MIARIVSLSVASSAFLLAGLAGRPAESQEQKAARPSQVTYLQSESSPLVAIRLIFPAGSQYDPPGKEGLAALTASLLSEGGTTELTYDQVLQKLYPMAASLSGSCFKEVTVFSGVVHRDNVKPYEKLVVDMIARPRFAPEDFERLKTETLQYLTTVLRNGNDEELGKAALLLALYPEGHPYAHVDEGTVAGLNSITLEDVRQFHNTHYTSQAVRLGIAGSAVLDHEQPIQDVLKVLPERQVTPPALPEPTPPEGLEVTLVNKPSADATAISLGFPLGITRADDDFYALAVANSYLGEHRTFNGKLMQDLRGKRGLNYGDYSYIEDFIQDGSGTFPVPNNPRRQQAFSIWIRPVPHDKAPFALRAALWELDRLAENGLTTEEFETTREYLLNYSKLWVQTLDRRLGYDMEGTFYGRKSLVDELAERLPKLTVDQVNAAIRKHLKSDGLRVAIVTKDAKALADLLKSNQPTPLVYDTEGTPDDILAEDKVIEKFPLRDVSTTIIPVEQMFEK